MNNFPSVYVAYVPVEGNILPSRSENVVRKNSTWTSETWSKTEVRRLTGNLKNGKCCPSWGDKKRSECEMMRFVR